MHCRFPKNIPSAIKWTGSKRSQAVAIARFAPDFSRYIEPFLGSGAVMYLASHEGAVGNDIYHPLVDLWKLIRDNPDHLIDSYSSEWQELNAELDDINLSDLSKGEGIPVTFYKVRDRFNLNPNPIDLNFLMRTCVNGIVRFNDQGRFNNSFHLSRRGMKPGLFAHNIRNWNMVLKGVELSAKDYKQTLDQAVSGNFVYLDPPYAGTSQRYFTQVDPNELFNQLDKLNSRGVHWALSYDGSRGTTNYAHDIPKDLYKKRRMLRSGTSAVKKVLSGPIEEVKESLYFNY